MKKLLFAVVAMAAMAMATSCSNEMAEIIPAGESVVSFHINAPEVATRAEFGDGTQANDLYYAVYLWDTKTNTSSIVGKISKIDKTAPEYIAIDATVEFKLVNGNTYSILFWAENSASVATIDWLNKTMTYNPTTANVETYDAFWAYVEPFRVTGRIDDKPVELYRPFAQVNIGTADFEDAVNAGTTIANAGIALTTGNTLDLVSGEVSGEVTTTYVPTALPTEEFPIVGYKYMSMNYVLVGASKHLVELTFNYNDGADREYTRTYNNVPVRRNYRTNIYGNLLTEDASYKISIKPNVVVDPEYDYNADDK